MNAMICFVVVDDETTDSSSLVLLMPYEISQCRGVFLQNVNKMPRYQCKTLVYMAEAIVLCFYGDVSNSLFSIRD